MKAPRFVLAALTAMTSLFVLAACASDGPSGPAYVVVEPNVTVTDRHLIRRISVLDDDLLLVESGANTYYQVRLLPGCVDFADITTPIRLHETSMGLDRTSRFVIGDQTCPVRSIDRVERVRPQNQAAAQPSGS